MNEEKYKIDIASKEKMIRRHCIYQFHHFCDGKANTSVIDDKKPLPPCPNRNKCTIKEHKIFD